MQWLPLLPRTSLQLWGFTGGGTWTREHRLSSCGAWASLFCSIWDLLGLESEPVSCVPAEPQGEPEVCFKLFFFTMCCAVLRRSVMSDSLQPQGMQPARLLCPWGFSWQEHWSGLPCPPPGDLPNLGTEPGSPIYQADSSPAELPAISSLYFRVKSYWIFFHLLFLRTYTAQYRAEIQKPY